MPVIPIITLDDPRVALYRNLKDRDLERRGRHFIAEGEHLTRRLLASDFPVDSVMIVQRRAAEMAPVLPDHIPAYVVSQELMTAILGLKFHSGVLACGKRKERQTLDQVVPRDRANLTLVICPEIANAENLGTMIRCHDPFWRQSVRVSMGAIFRLPLVQSDDLLRDLRRLREGWGVELVASVLDETAQPLAAAKRGRKLGILFGNEAEGLGREWIEACDRRVTIPMHHGTDSLNVAVAAGIFLYHFTSHAPPS
jgi:tRNA G18 (ribose-2'-O)-methylase SpoU